MKYVLSHAKQCLRSGQEFRSHKPQHTKHFQALVYVLLQRALAADLLGSIPAGDLSSIASLAVSHDVGKLWLPSEIIDKTGKLTDEEMELVKTHTVLGAAMVELAIPELCGTKQYDYAYEICLHHHERVDGSGYPDGLRGDEIPFYVQVIGIADAYDALISPRSYKNEMSHQKAYNMIVSGQCGTFAPELIHEFRRALFDIRNIAYQLCT